MIGVLALHPEHTEDTPQRHAPDRVQEGVQQVIAVRWPTSLANQRCVRRQTTHPPKTPQHSVYSVEFRTVGRDFTGSANWTSGPRARYKRRPTLCDAAVATAKRRNPRTTLEQITSETPVCSCSSTKSSRMICCPLFMSDAKRTSTGSDTIIPGKDYNSVKTSVHVGLCRDDGQSVDDAMLSQRKKAELRSCDSPSSPTQSA